MKWPTWVAKLDAKKIISLVIAIILLSGGLARYFTHKNHLAQTKLSIDQQIANGRTRDANVQLAQKNYGLAEDDYVTAAANLLNDQGPDQAIALLQQAIKKFPDNYNDWRLYDNLAGVARWAGNKQLEIQSFKTALAKAQKSNSGAPASTIETYKNQLKQLGATP